MKPVGISNGGNEINQRSCWIAAGRQFPTELKFEVTPFLLG